MWEAAAGQEAVAAEVAEAEVEEVAEAEAEVEAVAEEEAVEVDLPEDNHLPPQQQYKPCQLRQMETREWLGKNQTSSMDREAKATSLCRNLNST
jgi:hypothetical protein